jgi:Ca2+-binding EF-hand superfamily protein
MAGEWDNPMATSTDGGAFEVEPMGPMDAVDESSSVSTMIGLNQTDLSDDELTDLTYAFQAADMSAEGRLSLEEFHFMLEVMSSGMDLDQTRVLMAEAKAGFATWLKTSYERSREQCLKVWNAFDANQDNKLDLDEINAVIARLKEQGFSPKSLAPEDVADGSIDFDQFCAWFVAQENLKNFKAPSKKRIGLPTQRGGKKGLSVMSATAKSTSNVAEGLVTESTKM